MDLDILDGELIVFEGPSGCGKSNLLRMIAGLEDTSRGQILLDGDDVTHDLIEAMTLADRIVVLKDGQIMQVGSPCDLYEHPDNVFVAH